jgi:hypothetical protein
MNPTTATTIDWQTLFNIALSILSFLAAWIFKRNFDIIDKQEDKIADLEKKIYGIEISLPKEYVNKEDLNKFSEHINARFDKLEAKLDNIIERSK